MFLSQYYIIYSYFENSTLPGCYAASSGNYHYSLHNDPEEYSSQLLHGGSLKSHVFLFCLFCHLFWPYCEICLKTFETKVLT